MAVQLPPNSRKKCIGLFLFNLILFKYENKCKLIPKGMAASLPLNNRWKEMLRIYRQKMFNLICFCTKVYTKRVAAQLPPKISRNVKHLSLENVYRILLSTKISVRLYQKGWQFSSHLITGINVKHLSLENVTSYCSVRK